jgi:ABC-type branched-subunit amino acid transport system ATPase component
MFEVTRLASGYSDLVVPSEASLTVGKGDFVTTISSNAAGKSTPIRAAVGPLLPLRGEVAYEELAVVLEHSTIRNSAFS